MTMPHYTDEELVSFLDGACSDDLARKIATELETNAELQTRLSELELDTEALKQNLSGFLNIAPEPQMASHQETPSIKLSAANDNKPASRPFLRFAALLLAGVIGYGASFLGPEPAPQKVGWIGMVANYQQLYTPATLAQLSPTQDQTRDGLKHVSEKLGKEIDFSAATSRQDLSLKQTQILAFNGKPLAQLAYQSQSGVPLSLCIIKTSKAGDAAPSYKVTKNMQMALWRKDGYAYLLIGGQDKDLIKSAAEDLSQKL